MFGHLGKGHVVQFRGHLRPPESIQLKDGLPLFDSFVDGELGELRSRSSCYDFRPSASAGLGRRALRPVHCVLRGAVVRENRGEGEGVMGKLLPSVAKVRMGL